MNEEFLDIQDLVVTYTSGKAIVHAVNGVSLQLRRGEILGLVGETGAGKTTIAKSILRILPDRSARLAQGKIMLDGQDLLSLTEKEMLEIRGNKVSMIFQDPMTALNPVMTVGGQIAEAVQLHEHVDLNQAKKKTCEMLEMVGIPAERFNEYPHQFSGGMKQRVVIAMALACNPELLLADEPTSALDVTIQAQVLEMINELKQRFNMAMILITHDLGVVAETCQRVAIIYAGQIVEIGTKEEIFRHPAHPYTQGLFGSLPNMNSGAKRLHPIVGMPPDPTNLPKGCPFAPRCPHATDQCRAAEIPMKTLTEDHSCRCLLQTEG
ncbi:MAG: ABC transporter ATP-binding protein [Clostridia bacterium]|nr:ABC transporter ATP-binding protein [Clostridia bacterium]